MKKILSILLFVFLFFRSTIAIACSVFNTTTDDTVLAGRNHDYYDEADTWKYFIEFSPASKGKNGTFFCLLNIMSIYNEPTEGINDKGLFMGAAAVPRTPIINDNSKTFVNGDHIIRIILEKCSTVGEAIKELEKYYLYFDQNRWYPTHYMIAEPTGRSVVIEYVNKEIRVIEKKGNAQYMANSYLSDVKCDAPIWERNSRYREKALKNCLENKNTINVNDAFSILNVVSQGSLTQTSTVYDLKKKVVTIVWQREFDKRIQFNLSEELKKGYQIKETGTLNFTENPEASDPAITEIDKPGSFRTKSTQRLFENGWPAFSINYPAEWIEKNPDRNIVLRAETSSGMPSMQVSIFTNMNKHIPLEYSVMVNFHELANTGRDIKEIYNRKIKLKNGTLAQETEYDMASNTGTKLSTYFFTTRKEDNWICIKISNDKGKIKKDLKKIAYSLNIKSGEDKPADLPDDIRRFINKIEINVNCRDINKLLQNFSDKWLDNGINKSELESRLKMMFREVGPFTYRIVITKIEILNDKVNVAGFANFNDNKLPYNSTFIKENGQWKVYGNQKPKPM